MVHVDDLPELAVTEEVRIGSVDDPVVGFSRIRVVRVSHRGDVYVLDGSAREVRVFSSDGERLRAFGGQGEGPGEFSLPTNMGLLGDTLWVSDLSGQRITWFGPGGEVLFTTPARRISVEGGPPGMSLSVFPSKPRADGLIESELMRVVSLDRQIRPYTYPVVLFDRDGEIVDTMRWETQEENVPTYRVGSQEGYAPSLSPRRPVEQDMAGAGAGGGAGGLVVLDWSVPEFRPPLRVVHGGSDGTVWVQLNSPSTETADWVLIGDDGSPRGRLTMPVSLRIRHSDLPTVWAVETDDFDVPWLLRLRVEPPD